MAIKNTDNFKDFSSLKAEIDDTKQSLENLLKAAPNSKYYLVLFCTTFISNFIDYFEKAKHFKNFSATKAVSKVCNLLKELSPINPDSPTSKASPDEKIQIQTQIDHFLALLSSFKIFIYNSKDTIKEETINTITCLLNDDYYHYRYPTDDTDPFTYNYNWLWTNFKEIGALYSITEQLTEPQKPKDYDEIINKLTLLVTDQLDHNSICEYYRLISQLHQIINELKDSNKLLKEQNTTLQKEFINIQEQTDALLKNNKDLITSKFKVEFANDIAKVFLKYLNKVITEEDEVKRKAIEELRKTKEVNENWTDPHTEAFKNCLDKDCYPN